jgi:hypothetical protein
MWDVQIGKTKNLFYSVIPASFVLKEGISDGILEVFVLC